MKNILNPPTGRKIEHPQSSDVKSLILEQPSSYWEAGAGDASVMYVDDHERRVSEIIFLFRDPVGFYIQFFPEQGSNYIICNDPKDLQLENEITVTHGGAPLTLPLSYFVDRQTAAEVICAFIDNGDGGRPLDFNWVEN
jgi:hypothetical protein